MKPFDIILLTDIIAEITKDENFNVSVLFRNKSNKVNSEYFYYIKENHLIDILKQNNYYANFDEIVIEVHKNFGTKDGKIKFHNNIKLKDIPKRLEKLFEVKEVKEKTPPVDYKNIFTMFIEKNGLALCKANERGLNFFYMEQMGGKSQKAIDDATQLLNELGVDFYDVITKKSYKYTIVISKKRENLKKLNTEVKF